MTEWLEITDYLGKYGLQNYQTVSLASNPYLLEGSYET